jgi:hypothetical protein
MAARRPAGQRPGGPEFQLAAVWGGLEPRVGIPGCAAPERGQLAIVSQRYQRLASISELAEPEQPRDGLRVDPHQPADCARALFAELRKPGQRESRSAERTAQQRWWRRGPQQRRWIEPQRRAWRAFPLSQARQFLPSGLLLEAHHRAGHFFEPGHVTNFSASASFRPAGFRFPT